MSIRSRIKNAYNAFTNKDPTTNSYSVIESGTSYRPDRIVHNVSSDRTILNTVFNKIAVDAASISIKHCKVDEDGNYLNDKKSCLNKCLTLEANLDQTSRAFMQDAVYSMMDEGYIAIVPVDTDDDPKEGTFDVLSIRVGKIIKWFPNKVTVNVYNELTGKKQDITVPKRSVAIIENPLYQIVNERNSNVQRLKRKLNLLDVTDERTASGKLDLIIQLPYAVKSDMQRERADKRRKDIENQLIASAYGIAYIDSTEHVTQLNRPAENNLMKQVEYLTNLVFAQFGITQSILDGTADEQTMLNYYNRTVEPVVSAIVDEMKRKFLTQTARTRGDSIVAFRDPFKLVPINSVAEIVDKLTRNEVLTSNECRQIIGRKPSNDPKANMLLNSNLNHDNQDFNFPDGTSNTNEEGENQNE